MFGQSSSVRGAVQQAALIGGIERELFHACDKFNTVDVAARGDGLGPGCGRQRGNQAPADETASTDDQ